MADIKISKINETFMKVEPTDRSVHEELYHYFQFKPENVVNSPKYRYGKWDGYTRLYEKRTGKMYTGLLVHVLKYAKEFGYSVQVDPTLKTSTDIEVRDILKYVIQEIKPHSGGKPIIPHDYQAKSLIHGLKNNRSTMLAATSAGKSLILYLLTRMYQLYDDVQDERILIIVPSKNLVEQMYDDFDDYSRRPGQDWYVSDHCQKINGDYDKDLNRQVVISTYQSLADYGKDYFSQFAVVLVDEVHRAKGNTITEIMKACIHTKYRHGLTGTLDDVEVHKLVITGLFGPVKRIVTTKEIQDSGRAATSTINIMNLKYSKDMVVDYKQWMKDEKKLKGTNFKPWDSELKYLYSCSERTTMIQNLIQGLKGNTLVLFDRVEAYGRPLFEEMRDRLKDDPRTVCFIDGNVSSDERGAIKRLMEADDNVITYASYGTTSTGVSIKNIHNVVLASSSKSKVLVLQSIGRGLRLTDGKSHVNVFDIVDNIEFNIARGHADTRLGFYNKDQFPLKFHTFNLTKD